MKKNILLIILITFINAQSINSNVNSYKTNVVVRPVDQSLEVIAYVEIYNKNLQFLKKDTHFESSFDLNISVISKDGSKIADKSFSDIIKVKNFSQTVSMINPILIVNTFEIPKEEFSINFSLKDLDTKLVGKKQKKITKKNLSYGKYSKIFKPIFVKSKKGEWGFDANKYPTKINEVVAKENFIEFYQYISMDGYENSIDFSIISDKKNIWKKSFNQKNKDKFIELIRVPIKDIYTSDLRLKIEVSKDGKNVSSKSFPFELKNDLIKLSSAKNFSTALEQMNYILTTEERKELRGLKNPQKENFFKKVWAKRDPDVTTKQNELMVEYYKRVAFAEQNFSRGTSGGWRSDMGMIYILFGKPDDISRSINSQQSYNFQTWYYYQISEEFLFIDDFGFGDYRLRTPFLY
jgi:GWxTD domain-containing protein